MARKRIGMILLFIKILYITINVLIGLYDFSFYRIPNLFLAMLLVLYAFYAPLYLGLEDILNSLAVGGLMLFLSFLLFAFKFIGAGDAKYLSVTSLWVGLPGVISFILIFSLVGGILAVFYLVLRDPIGRFSDLIWLRIQKLEIRFPCFQSVWLASGGGPEQGKRVNISSRMIPYGIAIAFGAILVMVYNPRLF
jgi:prepilin peptidase CpaA